MSKNKILFIVEGTSDEVKFLRRLFKECFKKKEFKIYSYKTNIHVLAQELYNNYPDFDEDSIDIKLVLKSLETDQNQRKLLDERYNDVYLIFDFEPHHDHPHFDTVQRMLCYFNDSTNQGKLFLNYPMMQSYKHFSELPDAGFEFRKVSIADTRVYKEQVGRDSNYTDLGKYDYVLFYSLCVHHVKKANLIKSSGYILPSYSEYLKWSLVDIYNTQVSMVASSCELFVLNTCIFVLVDFAPQKFFRFVENRALDLLI